LKVEKVVQIGRFLRLKRCVGEKENFVLDALILSQCKDLKIGEIWLKRGVLEAARAADLRIS